MDQKGIFPGEIIRRLKTIGRLRNSVVHRQVLKGITSYALYDGRNVFDDRDALETFVNDADHVTKELNTWLDQHYRTQ